MKFRLLLPPNDFPRLRPIFCNRTLKLSIFKYVHMSGICMQVLDSKMCKNNSFVAQKNNSSLCLCDTCCRRGDQGLNWELAEYHQLPVAALHKLLRRNVFNYIATIIVYKYSYLLCTFPSGIFAKPVRNHSTSRTSSNCDCAIQIWILCDTLL